MNVEIKYRDNVFFSIMESRTFVSSILFDNEFLPKDEKGFLSSSEALI